MHIVPLKFETTIALKQFEVNQCLIKTVIQIIKQRNKGSFLTKHFFLQVLRPQHGKSTSFDNLKIRKQFSNLLKTLCNFKDGKQVIFCPFERTSSVVFNHCIRVSYVIIKAVIECNIQEVPRSTISAPLNRCYINFIYKVADVYEYRKM